MFRDAVAKAEHLDIARFVAGGCVTKPDATVLTSYDAPFPDESYKAGARAFPMLVPTTPDDPGGIANRKAWEVLTPLDLPFLCAFSDSDPITGATAPASARPMRGAAVRQGEGGRGRCRPPHRRERRPLPAGGRGGAARQDRRRLHVECDVIP